MKKKTFFVIAVIIIVVLVVLRIGYLIAPGSNPYSENYQFNVKPNKLFAIVKDFKEKNPSYKIPSIVGISDTVNAEHQKGGSYHVYFFYKIENQIVACVIESNLANSVNTSNISFFAINNGLKLGHWKKINEDYSSSQNDSLKKQFETRILNKLGLSYKNKGNSMSLW